jgi:hypothetical protein
LAKQVVLWKFVERLRGGENARVGIWVEGNWKVESGYYDIIKRS